MFAVGIGSSIEWLFVIGAGLLGAALSPVADILIARHLPRLGNLPTVPVRITTAALASLACTAFSLRFGMSLALPAFIFLAVLGVQLARIDVALHLLPNPLVIMLFAGGFLLFLMPGLFYKQADDLLRAALGAAILFVGYLILGLISPGGIGMGDVKLAAPVGLYLGYLGWTQLLYGGLLGFILNGLVSMVLVSGRGRDKAAEVAHGPSMLTAAAGIALLLP